MPLFSSKFAYKKSPVRRLSTNKSNTRNSHKGDDENDNNNEEYEEETASSADSYNEDDKTDGGGAADSEVKQIIKTRRKGQNRTKQNDKTSLALNPKFKKENNLKGKKSSKDPLSKSKTTASKQDSRKDSNVILYLDKSQGLCFQFQPKQGSWQEISGQKWKQQQQSNLLQSSTTNSNNSKSTEIVSNYSPDLVLKSQLTELADRNKVLEEENRLLKLKVEILMEMVTETTAELNLKNKCDN